MRALKLRDNVSVQKLKKREEKQGIKKKARQAEMKAVLPSVAAPVKLLHSRVRCNLLMFPLLVLHRWTPGHTNTHSQTQSHTQRKDKKGYR